MKQRYLEVTFRKGRPIAAYLYLPRQTGDHSVRTSKASPGLLVDYTAEGRPIGVEITAPDRVTLPSLNRLMARLDQPPLQAAELSPLMAA